MSEGNFECKVSGKRESANGIFLTLQIQPDDYDAALATLRVGSALMIGWGEIVDSSVQPIENMDRRSSGAANVAFPASTETPSGGGSIATRASPRSFASLPLSQQAALRCRDTQFIEFLKYEWPDEWADSKDAAQTVRDLCACKTSRAEMDNPDSFQAQGWKDLEIGYQQYLTDRQYADSAR